MSVYTVDMAAHGQRIALASAEKLAAALGLPVGKLFMVTKSTKPLAGKTVLEYYTLIHTILKDAYKNGYIEFNAAERVDRPKVESREVECFQPNEAAAILAVLDKADMPLI